MRVWRKRGERYLSGYVTETVKFGGGSVMVWAAIDAKGKIRLRRCPHRMKGPDYTKLLSGRQTLRFIRRRLSRHLFQQDGASPHTCKHTTQWLAKRNVRVLSSWPPQSPDLNLVEHLWPMVTQTMVGQQFPSADALWTALQSAFAAIPACRVRKLYRSYARRLRAVVVARGGHTRY